MKQKAAGSREWTCDAHPRPPGTQGGAATPGSLLSSPPPGLQPHQPHEPGPEHRSLSTPASWHLGSPQAGLGSPARTEAGCAEQTRGAAIPRPSATSLQAPDVLTSRPAQCPWPLEARQQEALLQRLSTGRKGPPSPGGGPPAPGVCSLLPPSISGGPPLCQPQLSPGARG